MGYEPATNPLRSTLRDRERTRDKVILEAYGQITRRISNMIEPDVNRAWKKFVHHSNSVETKKLHVIREFITPYCAVNLSLRGLNYIITLTVTNNCFKAGMGFNSTKLLRVAFDLTKYNREGFMIEDCLEIKIDNNIEATYKKQFEECHYQRELKFFIDKTGGKS